MATEARHIYPELVPISSLYLPEGAFTTPSGYTFRPENKVAWRQSILNAYTTMMTQQQNDPNKVAEHAEKVDISRRLGTHRLTWYCFHQERPNPQTEEEAARHHASRLAAIRSKN